MVDPHPGHSTERVEAVVEDAQDKPKHVLGNGAPEKLEGDLRIVERLSLDNHVW